MRINKISPTIYNKPTINFYSNNTSSNKQNPEYINREKFLKMDKLQRMNSYLYGIPMDITKEEEDKIKKEINALTLGLYYYSFYFSKRYIVFKEINENLISNVLGEKELADYMKKVSYINPSKKDIEYVKSKLIGRTFKEKGFTCCDLRFDDTNQKNSIVKEIILPAWVSAGFHRSKDNMKILVNRNYKYLITDVELKKNKNNVPKWILKTTIINNCHDDLNYYQVPPL